MTAPTPLTISVITAESASRRSAIAVWNWPATIHGPSATSSAAKCAVMNLPPLRSPAHQVELVRIDGLAVAEDRDDDREAHRGFGRRHRHHEKHDHLPVHRAQPPPQRDE